MPWYICWLLIMIAAALLVMAIYTVYRLHTPRKRSKLIEQAEEPPVQIRYAVARNKDIQIIQTGTTRAPGHYLKYRVLFRFDDGSEEWFQVLPEQYEVIPAGVREKLVTQNRTFLDFGDRFGEEIS